MTTTAQRPITLSKTAITAAMNTLPEHMIGGLMRYIEHGIEPGGFLSAVICNNLRDAVGRADEANKAKLIEWVQWFYWYAPSPSWGSEEMMSAWMAGGGIDGIYNRERND